MPQSKNPYYSVLDNFFKSIGSDSLSFSVAFFASKNQSPTDGITLKILLPNAKDAQRLSKALFSYEFTSSQSTPGKRPVPKTVHSDQNDQSAIYLYEKDLTRLIALPAFRACVLREHMTPDNFLNDMQKHLKNQNLLSPETLTSLKTKYSHSFVSFTSNDNAVAPVHFSLMQHLIERIKEVCDYPLFISIDEKRQHFPNLTESPTAMRFVWLEDSTTFRLKLLFPEMYYAKIFVGYMEDKYGISIPAFSSKKGNGFVLLSSEEVARLVENGTDHCIAGTKSPLEKYPGSDLLGHITPASFFHHMLFSCLKSGHLSSKAATHYPLWLATRLQRYLLAPCKTPFFSVEKLQVIEGLEEIPEFRLIHDEKYGPLSASHFKVVEQAKLFLLHVKHAGVKDADKKTITLHTNSYGHPESYAVHLTTHEIDLLAGFLMSDILNKEQPLSCPQQTMADAIPITENYLRKKEQYQYIIENIPLLRFTAHLFEHALEMAHAGLPLEEYFPTAATSVRALLLPEPHAKQDFLFTTLVNATALELKTHLTDANFRTSHASFRTLRERELFSMEAICTLSSCLNTASPPQNPDSIGQVKVAFATVTKLFKRYTTLKIGQSLSAEEISSLWQEALYTTHERSSLFTFPIGTTACLQSIKHEDNAILISFGTSKIARDSFSETNKPLCEALRIAGLKVDSKVGSFLPDSPYSLKIQAKDEQYALHLEALKDVILPYEKPKGLSRSSSGSRSSQQITSNIN